jgi:hypothetical protein
MWEALARALGCQLQIAVVITLSGRAGAVYHVGFPILNRPTFGLYGSLWLVNTVKLDLWVRTNYPLQADIQSSRHGNSLEWRCVLSNSVSMRVKLTLAFLANATQGDQCL